MVTFWPWKEANICDLPGYGFSAIKKDVRKWQHIEYVKRPNIKSFIPTRLQKNAK